MACRVVSVQLFYFCRHRDEIIKFQTEVGDLKNELCLSQNEIYKLKVNKYSKLETASCRDLNKISDPEETPRLGMKRKKCCKDLLAIALDVEVRVRCLLKVLHVK